MTMRKIAEKEGVSLKAVYSTIKRFGMNHTFKDLPGRGRKRGPLHPNLDKKICEQFARNKGISIRDCAKKCQTSLAMVQRAKERNMLVTYKKQKQPKRTKTQESTAKTRARKLYDNILTKNKQCIIMDDETYVKLDYKTLPGPQFYTVTKDAKVPKEDKSIFCEKFGQKVMVWQAICQCGMKTTPFFVKGNLNADIYRKECLQKRILPLIRKHRGPTLFWPDLAACHYARHVLDWYRGNNVDFVPKTFNPPNCPQIRPIERFWALMKARLRKHTKPTDNVEQFKKDWIRTCKTFNTLAVQRLMKNIKSKVRKLAKETSK